MTRRLAAVLAAGLVAASCGGDSAEDVAKQQVCDARADIAKQVDALQQLTPATATTDSVRGNVEAIRNDLRTIRDAQPQLSDERRSEVRAANEAFTAQVRDVASTVLRSTSVEEARTQLRGATEQLRSAYRSTLGTVGCD